jgi:RNA polymerase sigma factor (sigma-70 family)
MDRTLRDISEEWLVVEAQCGDAESWRLLVEIWDERLRRRAARHLGAACPDVVQDVWVSVARGLRRLDDPARFGPWVYRILARRCADQVRRKVRDRRVAVVPMNEPEEAPSDEVEALRRAMKRMDPMQRLLLSMRHSDGLSVRAIAKVLGIAQGTVKSRLSAARDELRRVLAADGVSAPTKTNTQRSQ